MSNDSPSSREPRTSVMLSAHIFRANVSTPTQHRLVNISRTGICIKQPDGIAADTAVAVSVGEVEHAAADVVWVRDGMAGLRFRIPIDLAAARRRRVGAVAPPAAGWIADLNDPYRR